MRALAIIEAFDVIEDGGAGLVAGGKVTPVDQVQFEGAPEAFPGGVVIAVAAAAHRGDQTSLTQRSPVTVAGVLDAAIGVEEQIGWRLPMQEGHAQSF